MLGGEDGRRFIEGLGLRVVGGTPEMMRDRIDKESAVFRRVIELNSISAQ
jgi:hypothetical protein